MAEREELDLVVTGGTVFSGGDSAVCDVGVRDGRIVALGERLRGEREIDARGRLVLPGGVESHCHIEQESSLGGIMTADDFFSGTRAAAFGGNTAVVPFACQHRGHSLLKVVDAYSALARAKSVLDYAFHLLVTDPTSEVLGRELPELLEAGHRTVKLYMAYDIMRVGDLEMLQVMEVARRHGALVMVHAENWDMIRWAIAELERAGTTEPRHHPESHPQLAEVEAIQRLLRLSELSGARVLVVHVSTEAGLNEIRRARERGTTVYAETCPQYLVLTAEEVDTPGPEGAKYCCSPPLRDSRTQAALWSGVVDGTFELVSSDHCPYRFDRTGKLARSERPTFKEVPNGLPGIEVRLPLLFSRGVNGGRIGLSRFVALSSTNAAKLNGLYPRKGAIAVGADADLAIWDPDLEVHVTADRLHDEAGYSPYEGQQVRGWPITVLSRGEVVVQDGELRAQPGRGQLLVSPAAAADPTKPGP